MSWIVAWGTNGSIIYDCNLMLTFSYRNRKINCHCMNVLCCMIMSYLHNVVSSGRNGSINYRCYLLLTFYVLYINEKVYCYCIYYVLFMSYDCRIYVNEIKCVTITTIIKIYSLKYLPLRVLINSCFKSWVSWKNIF